MNIFSVSFPLFCQLLHSGKEFFFKSLLGCLMGSNELSYYSGLGTDVKFRAGLAIIN